MSGRLLQAIYLVPTLLWVIPLPSSAAGPEKETAGVITEIKPGRGRVEVRAPGSVEWRQAQPLQALKVGDLVRATEDAKVVVMLSGRRGSVTVESADSSFLVPPPAEKGKVQKFVELLQASLGFLSARAEDTPRVPIATRREPGPPEILTPRNGLVLPYRLTFEWRADPLTPYTIRIVGPSGVVLERRGVKGARLDYPPEAPELSPGVRYTLELLSTGYSVQAVWFEVVDPSGAQAIEQDLGELERTLSPTVSPNSLAVVRVGFLASRGLLHDARRLLVSALNNDPDEPTFHLLLGDLFVRLGLPEVAAESHSEAQFLLRRGSRSPRSQW